MTKSITEIQEKVFQTIIQFVEERGFPPTIREIMGILGYSSVNNVQRILNILEKKGFIKRNQRGGARCIEVVNRQITEIVRINKIPILGTIAAGSPLFAEQNIDGYITLDPESIGIHADFILRVSGNSMQDANIYVEKNRVIYFKDGISIELEVL